PTLATWSRSDPWLQNAVPLHFSNFRIRGAVGESAGGDEDNGELSRLFWHRWRARDRPKVHSSSQGYHRSVPVRAHAAQQRRVYDQFSERIDCRHVERRQPADATDVDREVKAVAIRGFNQRAQRRRVDRPVDQFDEFFVLEPIDDAKQPIWPLANARRG